MKAIDLSKQQALDTDPEVIQQINFTENLERNENENATTFFNIKESKDIVLDFSQGIIKVF